jgi:hypothetical protein
VTAAAAGAARAATDDPQLSFAHPERGLRRPATAAHRLDRDVQRDWQDSPAVREQRRSRHVALVPPLTLSYTGAPLAAALAGVLAYRVLSCWRPMPPSLDVLPVLRAMREQWTAWAAGKC